MNKIKQLKIDIADLKEQIENEKQNIIDHVEFTVSDICEALIEINALNGYLVLKQNKLIGCLTSKLSREYQK